MRQSILSLLFFLLTNMLYSQLPPQGNVSTPKGSPVTAYITPEMSNAERAYWDANYSSPNRNYIYYFNDGYSSSFRFNCHGYAWNMSEGGPVRWIGFEYTTDEDIYMTDGSYIQVCNEIYPGKVSWIGGDHSAVTTSTPGRWTSKWNKYPLMTHYKDDTPFGINYAYYASTMVNGSTASLCSGTRIFSVQNIPGATYTWTYSSTLSVAGATNASQLTVQQNGSSNGAAWVQVQISTPCSSTTVTNRKDFIVGLPPLSVTSYVDRTPQASNYQYLTATATQLAGTVPSDYKWYKEEANNVRGALLATGLQLIQYPIPPCTTIYYQCVATTSCGEIVYRGYAYNTKCGSFASTYGYEVYPNPTSDELIVAYQPNDVVTQEKVTQKDFEVRLLNSNGKELKFHKNLAIENKIVIDVRNIPNDTYFLHIKAGKEVIKQQVIIQH